MTQEKPVEEELTAPSDISQAEPKAAMTLADVFALVWVTPGQGVGVLSTMAQENSDQDADLVKAINDAIEHLQTQ